jgi:TetR/AcrR family transcriptional regulator
MPALDPRAKLVAVATPLFAAKGYHAVTVREIARLGGVNLSMISYYFQGKEGLYRAVLEEQFAVLHKVAKIADVEAAGPIEKFEQYVRGAIARYRENPYLLSFYTGELTNPTPCFETIVKPAIKQVILMLQSFFSDGAAGGEFRELHPTATAITLAGMINFYFLLEPVTRELIPDWQERDEELTRHIMEIFQKGVVA